MAKTDYKRDSWSNKWDFLLTCIGYAVGVSNIWRFPYLCLQNGGGAFLIPYLLTVLLCGIPIACLEFCLGQYVGLGLFPFWEICPLFKGIGLMCLCLNIGLVSYFIFVIVLALYYLCASIATTVPWKYCNHAWNTEYCQDTEQVKYVGNGSSSVVNSTSVININIYDNGTLRISPAEEYLTNQVLRLSDGLEDIGAINWRLFLCLVVAWLFIYLATIKSVKSAGKVVYFTATFPYLMLTVFLIRGITLPGSFAGLKYYLLPEWKKLLEPQVWYSAVQQVFLSLGVAYGCFTTLAGYNKFNNNCYRDAVVTTLINSATSIYGGLVVFSVLGFMAHELNLSMHEVVQSGPGLAFIAYPRAMATMPLTQLWSVLFFLMLIILGVGSEFVHFETILVCITDQFPGLRPIRNRILLATAVVIGLLLCGIIYITNGGMYVFTLIDWYCTPFPLMLAGILECIIFPWFYGIDKLCENTKVMIGHKPNIYFRICWKYLSPTFILLILIVNLVTWKSVTYGDYVFPGYANAIGWMIALLPTTLIVIVAIYKIWQSDEPTLLESIRSLMKPSQEFQAHMAKRATVASMNKQDSENALSKELETLSPSSNA